jgi:hypothetical protein
MLGRELLRANYLSYAARYGDPVDEVAILAYAHHLNLRHMSMAPVAVLKAVASYEYQCCEVSNWEGSPAEKFCDWMRRKAIYRLPGYDDAAWEIRDDRSKNTVRRIA